MNLLDRLTQLNAQQGGFSDEDIEEFTTLLFKSIPHWLELARAVDGAIKPIADKFPSPDMWAIVGVPPEVAKMGKALIALRRVEV